MCEIFLLTHSFSMHSISTPRKCFEGVEKGCIGNEWVKKDKIKINARKITSATKNMTANST